MNLSCIIIDDEPNAVNLLEVLIKQNTKWALLGKCYDALEAIAFLKDNQPDLGSHIANAGYMTAPSAAGQGVGKAMGEFSLSEAKRLGYKAMQFNIVVKSNERAVRLWQHLGFKIIGEIPEAFQNKQGGLTNAYIMYQKL